MKMGSGVVRIDESAVLTRGAFGAKAERLSTICRLGVTIPRTVAVSIGDVQAVEADSVPDVSTILEHFHKDSLLAVRSSPEVPEWGGAHAMLNVGMNTSRYIELCRTLGRAAATDFFLDFIQSYSVNVAKLDLNGFEEAYERNDAFEDRVGAALDHYEKEAGERFPQTLSVQLVETLGSMARAWEGVSARMLRIAHGAPDNAGLGLIVQEVIGINTNERTSSAKSSLIDPQTGEIRMSISCESDQGPGKECYTGENNHEGDTAVWSALKIIHHRLRQCFGDVFEVNFAVDKGIPFILSFRPARRTVSAEIRVSVEMVRDRIIDKSSALRRIEPKSLSRVLHPYIRRSSQEEVIVEGIAASPGAASGEIVFSSNAAKECAANNKPCILVRVETGPEDIRGMHTAQGVLTGRGGMTSHAAVIARSLGVPCVAGASELTFDAKERLIIYDKKEILREGDIITVDGSGGAVLRGMIPLVKPRLDSFFEQFMSWADEFRDIDVWANADSLEEVHVAMGFGAQGIGLCRTEHMFFAESRLTVMREMIFAEGESMRQTILDELLPIQRGDFLELFKNLPGRSVCIRLFDPPLHEFLPRERDEIRELADALNLPVSKIVARIDELREFNPMLGMRGVRLGITVPEIYRMQARAIFEAAAESNKSGNSVIPEIMIPLVSANREVEIVRELLDSVAVSVRRRTNQDFQYKVGVMVETPRAALRAGDLAEHSSFLSFGTNDLTQLTYGISRDDAERIIDEYIRKGVYPEDPFSTIDREGVGEMLLLAVERAKKVRSDLVLSICGEHAADPETIQFCREAGFNYVSCSPFRVPIARLAAAQCAISNPGNN